MDNYIYFNNFSPQTEISKKLKGFITNRNSVIVLHLQHDFISRSWWRHQTETFATLLALYPGNSPVTGEFPSQTPVTRNFHVAFDLRVNKRLSKQSWHRWFETPSRSLQRYCNVWWKPSRFLWVMPIVSIPPSGSNASIDGLMSNNPRRHVCNSFVI